MFFSKLIYEKSFNLGIVLKRKQLWTTVAVPLKIVPIGKNVLKGNSTVKAEKQCTIMKQFLVNQSLSLHLP